MLTGMGADDIHEMHPYDLNDLLREGKLIEAWREAIKWAKVRNCNVWNVLKPFGIDPLVNAWLPWLSSGNFLQKSLTLKEQNDLTVPPWIRQDFVKQYALASRIQKNTNQVYFLCQQASLSVMISGLMSRAGEVLRWSVAAPLGIAIAHPFLDSRVLALGLGIRQKIPAYPGKMKPILAEAMGELLPPKITERKRKGHFNEVYYLGLAKNVDYLEEMIEKAPIDELKIFDKPILRQAVREASLGTADARQLQRLDLSLCLIKWLSMQEQWQKIRTPIDKAIFIRKMPKTLEGVSS
jgi:asparagine synthase (glutamine-hydrolysing)